MWTSFSIASAAASSGVWKSGPIDDVEAEVGEGRRDHLLPAVVAVLADLGDEDARRAAVAGGECGDQAPGLGDALAVAGSRARRRRW